MSFHHATVTKCLMMGTAATSLIASILDVKPYLNLQLVPHLSRHHQFWRLFVHHVAFSNSSELLLAELLLYNISIPIERMFGSYKFASFAMISMATSTALEVAALLLGYRSGLNVIPSGPFALLFSILYQFVKFVPHAYTFRIFGVTVTNKAFYYVLALQMVLSQPPGSLVAALIGLLSGQLYRSDVLGLKSYRLPLAIRRLSSKYLLPLMASTNPARRTNRALPDSPHGAAATSASTSLYRTFAASRRASPAENAGNSAAAASSEASRRTRGRNAPGSRDDDAPRATDGDGDGSDGDGGDGSGRSAVAAAAAAGLPSSSMMREWVNEFTGRTERTAAGLRVPSDTEIDQLTSMFPDLRREEIVGALQRSPNIEAAVDTLLSSQN